MGVAFLFPGQGSQTAGFLRRLPDVPAVHQILERSSNFLGYDVLTLDTKAALASTISVQIGLVIAGAAFGNFFSVDGVEPRAVAGMSVGTFAAAVACGAVTLEVALALVQRRAELMESTFRTRTDGMAAVQGLRLEQVESILEGTGLSITNFNSQTQFVVAGPVQQLESLLHRARQSGASKAIILSTSVPSHIRELIPAAQQLLALARQLPVRAPSITMFSNRHARPITTAEGVREELALNMASPVRWHDVMAAIAGLGITLILESSPGSSLTALASESIPGAHSLSGAEMRWDVLLAAARVEKRSRRLC